VQGAVRQFLYIDVDRVRSYLAQLDEGVLESVVDRAGSDKGAKISAQLFGVGPEGSISGTSGREESRSMQDLTFSYFEENANSKGWILDLDESYSDPDSWDTSAVHDTLAEGQLIRVTSQAQVFDATFFRQRLDRLRAFSRAVIEVSSSDALAGKSQRDRDRIIAQAERQMWDGTDPSLVGAISDVMVSLLGEEIALRVLPCGREHPEYSFGGVLLNRSDYLQKEREALFSRFGSFLSGWTFVMQVETVPYQMPPQDEGADSTSEASVMRPDEQVSRNRAVGSQSHDTR
jgi:hypothetical protein